MKELIRLLEQNQIKTVSNCPLASHSTFRVGGFAALAAFPDTKKKMIDTLHLAAERGVRYSVFGNASNVVFADEGFDGLILFTGACREMTLDGNTITAACGTPLWQLASLAAEKSLGGSEFLHGIPGTVGGAVFMNAGAFEGSVSQICTRSVYWDRETREVGVLEGSAHAFGNRTSIYAQNARYVLLEANFELTEGREDQIRARMAELLQRRRQSQPLEYPSAGSVFKRPIGHFAGKLIQDCGLKGYSVGGAQVSQKHAGFIINTGGATAADIRTLTAYVQKTVLEKTGVELECEIQFIEP
jgi:UDP-N-acetylmuramate dehydrogenase